MEDEITMLRALAVMRFKSGESPEAICTSLGKSKSWLYKWIARSLEDNSAWNKSRSRSPLTTPTHTPVPPQSEMDFQTA